MAFYLGLAKRVTRHDPFTTRLTHDSFSINPNPLISCRVHVGFTGRVKIAGPNSIPSCIGGIMSNYGHFMEDARRYMSDLATLSFVHVVRGANSSAHILAKEACTHVIDKYWWHSIPSCIGGIIRKEELSLLS